MGGILSINAKPEYVCLRVKLMFTRGKSVLTVDKLQYQINSKGIIAIKG
jgi:hypothetical protein